ncbi:MAG: hypothetical protein ACI9MC_000817 [Kiritimatiellia bacterium]|jgi:hypothetical protein
MHRLVLIALTMSACGGGEPGANVVGDAPGADTVWAWQLTEGSASKLVSATVADDGSFEFSLDASTDAFVFEAMTGGGETIGRATLSGVSTDDVSRLAPMTPETLAEALVAVALAESGAGPVSLPDLRSRVDSGLADAILAASDVDAAAASVATGVVAAQDAEVAAYLAIGVTDDIASWAAAEAAASGVLDDALNNGDPQPEAVYREALRQVAIGKGVDAVAWMEAEMQASIAMRFVVRDGADPTFAKQAIMAVFRHEGQAIDEGVVWVTEGDAIATEFVNAGNDYTVELLAAKAVPACVSAHDGYGGDLVGRVSASETLIAYYVGADANEVGPIESALAAARNGGDALQAGIENADVSGPVQASTEAQRLFGDYRNLVGGVAGTFLDPYGGKAAAAEQIIVAATGGLRGD